MPWVGDSLLPMAVDQLSFQALRFITNLSQEEQDIANQTTVLEKVRDLNCLSQIFFQRTCSHEFMFCFVFQTDIDECQSLPCQHNGTCTESLTPGQYMCSCVDGWTGQNCESLPQFCNDSTCENDGQCFSLQDNFFCKSVTD